ncbi:hypothetical protein SAMN05421874_12847 [Nonomuraea maritima]|uniref:Uncharacterized protein n=1 Tax=Nonomuraea maritima TaxID=683260 RepID=A0A1G9MHV3_9ACTN|nr:hypothetical protein [Nonomuraea maritima]SDL73852.1 hypothetical protein SAMN05421874_12847 [Nonomuraea maritima]
MRNLQHIVALFDELGVPLGAEDRRAVNALAGLDPQDLRAVLALLRKTHQAVKGAPVRGGGMLSNYELVRTHLRTDDTRPSNSIELDPAASASETAELYAAVVRRVHTRWPDATPEGIAAALQSRAPEAAALYEIAGPELEQLAAGNPALQEALAEITSRSAEREP